MGRLTVRRFLEEMPIWMASFIIAVPFTLAAAALGFTHRYSSAQVENVGLSSIVILLYAVRNIGILYFFTYGESRRRVETATVICIAILSWLLPSIAESMGLTWFAWLLRPPLWDEPLMASAIVAVHVVAVGFLCAQRYWQRIAPAGVKPV